MLRGTARNVHFVGVGGAGMSVIAELLLSLGYQVRGSDARDSEVLRRLRSLGTQVFVGHDASHVADADVLVY